MDIWESVFNFMNEQGSCSLWYTRAQGALFILAFLTFGVGDGLTSLWMMEQRGFMSEANPIARDTINNFGASGFIGVKIWFTTVVLFIPFMIQQRSHKPVYWMITGYLVSYIVAGTLAIILNIRAAMYESVFLSPQQVIFLFLSSVLLLTQVGEEIDRRTTPKKICYLDCAVRDAITALAIISDITYKKK